MAETRVAHTQGVARTKASPSRTSCRVWRTPWSVIARRGRAVMASTAAAEATKLAASSRKAGPEPTPATMKPPSAGPIRRTISGRSRDIRALARGSWSSGSRSGTMAVEAGLKKASPSPTKAIRATTCHSSRMPHTESRPSTAMAAARTRSAPTISQRRS